MKVLVTGGSGFIGRNLVDYLSPQYKISAPSSAELNLLDACAVKEYLAAGRFDVIVHAATVRSNRRLGAPPQLLHHNCRMFFHLARNQRLFGKMICFGSGAEYDREGLPSGVSEDYFDTRVPSDAYGFSKYICAKYVERSDHILNLRLFGVFGKYEDYTVRFISNACCRSIKGMPIAIRQDLIFDYLYVEDVARIAAWCIEHDARQRALNLSRGEGTRLTQLGEMVAKISGRNPQVIVGESTLGPEYTADNSLLLSEIGGYRFRDLLSSIQELYSWYETQEAAIAAASLRFDETADHL